MNTQELLKKIKRIEIKAKGASKQLFSGQYHSAFKGLGLAFSEVRQYFPGDETRAIDWNVTARFNEPFIKTFEEEREICVMLLVDVSSSSFFGTASQNKREYMAEICAVLAFSAIQNNDKVGVLFFSDQVEKYIPPSKGKQHVLRIISDLLNFTPIHKNTNIGAALSFFNQAVKRRCSAFLFSDFIDELYQKQLKLTASKHDLMVLKINDSGEATLPDLGWVSVLDAENGSGNWVNTSDKQTQSNYLKWKNEMDLGFKNSILKSGVDAIELNTENGYIKELRKLFNQKGR